MAPKAPPGFVPNTHGYAQPRRHPQWVVDGDLSGIASIYRGRETHRMDGE